MNLPRLRAGDPFPHASTANEHGIVAFGGDLSPTMILNAYRAGIFPWFNEDDPILWWSPNPRCLLFVDDLYVNKSLSKRIRNGGFTVKFDTNFAQTIRSCRKVNGRDIEGTWLQPSMVEAYENLHALGYAHSVETYLNGKLVGGLYGISLGSTFFGESMFSFEKDASKIALVALTALAKENGFSFIDCQVPSQHLINMGACVVERDDFLTILEDTLKNETRMGSWSFL